MLHGQRLVLLVYLHLTLVVQYNIILIIINSIYTILLFANKQWGDCIIKIGSIEQDVDFPISFKSYVCCSVGILQEAADTVIIKHMDKHTTASTIRFRLSQVSSGVDTWIKFLSIGK